MRLSIWLGNEARMFVKATVSMKLSQIANADILVAQDLKYSFIRDNTSTVPWPQVEAVLRERGYNPKEIAAALDEVFPGQKGAKKK